MPTSSREDFVNGLLTGRPPNLNAVVSEISYKDGSIIGNCHAVGVTHLALSLTNRAERCKKPAVRRKFLNPVVVKISGEDGSVPIYGNAGHGSEPSVKRPVDIGGKWTAPFVQKLTVWFKNLDAVVVAIGDYDRAIWGQRHVARITEHACARAGLARYTPLADESSVGAQLLYSVTIKIGNKNAAVSRKRDAGWRAKAALLVAWSAELAA